MEVSFNETNPQLEQLSQEFNSDLFNVTGEPDDFSILFTNVSEDVEMEISGRRC